LLPLSGGYGVLELLLAEQIQEVDHAPSCRAPRSPSRLFPRRATGGDHNHPTWTYQGNFHNAIAKADRMVIIDAGFDCYGRDTKAKTLFEVSKPDEVRGFAEHLAFQQGQIFAMCPCNGYPRVDWYRGKDRLATVSIQHGRRFAGKDFRPMPN
jgi:hypothetical protein